MNIRISAIICTYNRADYLRKAIKSLTEQTLSKKNYEILIVDNGSTDNTKELVIKESHNTSNIRYIYEPVIGLSQARNTGWQNAKGEYVAYLDDDAIAFPNWLEKILEVFEKISPKAGCVGGKIELIWEMPRPSWISTKKLPELGKVDWGDSPIFVNNNQWIAGGNIAFPRRILEHIGGFLVYLGRKGKKLLSTEEILLQREIEKRGYRCYYHPEIVVRHCVLPSRLTKDWFLRRAFWQGVSDASILMNQRSPSIMWRLRKGLTTILRILLSPREVFCFVVQTNNPDFFALKCSVLARIGGILRLWEFVK